MASSDIQPLLDTQPPNLPFNVARVTADGRPTSHLLDWENFSASWFRSNIVKTDQRIDTVKAAADDASAAVTVEANARASADEALAEQITTVSATATAANTQANKATATGQIYFAAKARPSGAAAAYGLYLTAGNAFTGMELLADSAGNSSIGFAATSFKLTDSGTAQNVFNYTGGVFTFNVPVRVQTIDIAQQAVTVPSTAAVGGTGSGDTAGGWVTLLTITVNGGSGYALVLNTDFAYIATSGGGTGTITGSWRILKDGGNALKSGGLGVYADYNPVFISLLDVNIPGTHTYQFQIYVQATNGKAFQFSNITFLADLRKR